MLKFEKSQRSLHQQILMILFITADEGIATILLILDQVTILPVSITSLGLPLPVA